MTSCERCGTALRPDDDYCTQCAEPAVRALRTRRRVAAPTVVAAVIALLVAAGAAAWFVLTPEAEVAAVGAEGGASPAPDPSTLPRPTSSGPATSTEPAAALAAQVAADRPTAEATVGYWVPQISSKSVGMQRGAGVYDAGRILDEFREANRTYDAFLVRSDDYSTFQRSGYWVTLVPQPFTDAHAAVSWCADHGFSPDDCFAKRLSHTDAPDGNTVHWNR